MIILLKIFHSNYAAMTIWPFIFIKDKSSKLNHTLINHEKIHLKQQIELLWFLFFLWYVFEFLYKLIKYKKWDTAYRAISFEREAYANEHNLDYLKNRKIWSFWKYL
ncbi:MAG TPA: hypothetical protein EYG92_11980 [Lutibacter sp.]|nr:hypothetical protein [Lutibacter sp.]